MFACVILTVVVPLCVGACAHGAQFLLHTCTQHCAGMSCLAPPLPVNSLRACGASRWLPGRLSVAILIHVTSDPERACPWLRPMCRNVWLAK